MGAHLGRGGCVEDGAIRCPFHGMRFDGTGACVSIPGEVKIPPAMKTPAWEAREVDGAVLVWHDPAGAPPSFEPPAYFELRGSEGATAAAELREGVGSFVGARLGILHLVAGSRPGLPARCPRAAELAALRGLVAARAVHRCWLQNSLRQRCASAAHRW